MEPSKNEKWWIGSSLPMLPGPVWFQGRWSVSGFILQHLVFPDFPPEKKAARLEDAEHLPPLRRDARKKTWRPSALGAVEPMGKAEHSLEPRTLPRSAVVGIGTQAPIQLPCVAPAFVAFQLWALGQSWGRCDIKCCFIKARACYSKFNIIMLQSNIIIPPLNVS